VERAEELERAGRGCGVACEVGSGRGGGGVGPRVVGPHGWVGARVAAGAVTSCVTQAAPERAGAQTFVAASLHRTRSQSHAQTRADRDATDVVAPNGEQPRRGARRVANGPTATSASGGHIIEHAQEDGEVLSVAMEKIHPLTPER
jgi:hypothetical protein